jgi:EmrB/QacA subfamily drug resistance transporter
MCLVIGRSASAERLDPYVKRVAIVVVLGMIMSVLDTTIVNVALDSLSHDLHTSINDIQWVVSAYLLALAAVIPISAWATRRFSAYRVYMVALALFTLGSALCGFATSAPELIAFRVLQGAGGGLLAPTGMAILVNASGRQALPKVMGAIGIPIVLAPVFGPTLGGILLQSVSWHAIFWVNVPIGVVTAALAMRLLPRDQAEPDSAGPLDWPGLMLAGLGIVGIMYGLSETATAGSFGSMSVILPLFVGILLVGAFVIRARVISHPLVDLRLYRIRAYSAASVAMFFLVAAMFGAMILLPLYFQVARGQDAIHTGLLMVPQGVGASIGMNRSTGTTRRLGGGLASLIGIFIMIGATAPFLFVGATTPFGLIASAQFLRGIGVGLATMPTMTAAFSVLAPEQVNDGSPQLNVIQRVGGALGTAIIAVILQEKLSHLAGASTGTYTNLTAVAASFAETYRWVLLITVIALIPATVLWRVERQLRSSRLEAAPSEESLVEAIA